MAEFTLAPERNCVPLPSRMTGGPGRAGRAALDRALRVGPGRCRCAEERGRPRGRADRAVRRHGSQGGRRGRGLCDREGRGPGTGGRHGRGADWTGSPDREDIVGSDPGQRVARPRPSSSSAAESRPRSTRPWRCSSPAGRSSSSAYRSRIGVSFDSSKVRRKEIRIQNVRRQNRCLEKAVGMIHAGRVKVDFLATHFFGLDLAARGLRDGRGPARRHHQGHRHALTRRPRFRG
ncbi:MAG: hypothetical protein MZV63_41255 [Marinilabiliales bacterium]|nr:hypothetical protein [Marinilabiliales bacterium]